MGGVVGKRGAVRFTVRGVVQGVGFRPFVFREATALRLAGYVANAPGAVVVHAEGDPGAIARLRRALAAPALPAARVARVAARRVAPGGFASFDIRPSEGGGPALSTIPPDIAACRECLREVADPRDRRHAYPFTNCTNCGPRFTIVTRLPYDRARTSMAPFPPCPDCRREYGDPADRRFHAEPVACPACGPRLALAGPEGAPRASADPVGDAAAALAGGAVVAVRGLGGFQLSVDAGNEEAVRRLRERKRREEKPFAVMVPDLAAARVVARLCPADAAILSSPAAPILLLPLRRGSPLAPSVAPGLREAGLFLPYTPLHRLLLERAARPLVMTSGNATDEPIAIGNGEALSRLRGIADLFLLHDREVVQRADDSVVRRVGRSPYPLRRARGFVPAPVRLPLRRLPALSGRAGVAGLGAELKGTFCIAKGGVAYLSQHIGDLDRPPAREFYDEALAFFREFLDVELEAVCRDLHPAYYTTGLAERLGARRVVALQHHKAHLYALLAESGFSGKAVGVAFDGTGYGEDGTVWGGEFFAVDGMEMRRAGALAEFPLQGGDSAVREPWKAALGLLLAALGPDEAAEAANALFPEVPRATAALVLDALAKGVNVVGSSSAGRLFDAVSAVAGVCRRASYEGQAAMLLEARIAGGPGAGVYNYALAERDGLLRLDWRGTVEGAASDARAGVPPGRIARRFHDTLAAMVLDAAGRIAEGTGARAVLLSGGVFQNAYLLARLLEGFRKRGLKTLRHREVPANDGGLSLGQAFYAACAAGRG